MILDPRVNVWWLLWMRHDTDIQRAPAGHKNWGDKGGGGDRVTGDTIMTESRAQDQDPAETIALNYNEETA